MSKGAAQLLAVGTVDSAKIGFGWQNWLAEHGHTTLSVDEFPDGEIRARLPRVAANVDVYCDFRASSTHRFDMQQLLHVCAVARAARQQGARRVRLVTPEVPGMRQDRPISRSDSVELAARELVLDLLAAAGFQTVCASYMKFDVSSQSLELRFPKERDLADWLLASGQFRHGAVIALDQGGADFAAAVANAAHVPALTLGKRRDDAGVTHTAPTADDLDLLSAAGSALIVDDLLVSGGSLSSAASELAQCGVALDLDAFVWHVRPGKSDLSALAELQDSGLIDSLLTSNLSPGAPGAKVIPADSLLVRILEDK